ncbi:pyridoxal 5'-phosphate synthase [Nocardia sp. NPDC051570]|uniref:pyridoxal 5'-phosphate synthase n=1 Tax=Nocardia sp. NPDC051570 TaxID=3364324 RepID=UPI00378E20AD
MTEHVVAGNGLRAELRTLPVLKGVAPEFDPDVAPDNPVTLFRAWITGAMAAGVTEPHAMALSTVDEAGRPSARMVILKDADIDGWHFSTSSASRKGRHLAVNPYAALTFYWPEVVRQVRVCGPVVADPPEVAAADFLDRPAGSRQMALTRRQSEPFTDSREVDRALEQARLELASDPDLVPHEWISYAVRADQVEFWQGDPGRRHRRLRYEASDGCWTRNLLWP